MSNYPLCEKAGLTIYEGDGYIDDNIKADAVERYLESLKTSPNELKSSRTEQPEMTYKAHMEWAAKQFDEPKEHDVAQPNLGNQSPELGDLALRAEDVPRKFAMNGETYHMIDNAEAKVIAEHMNKRLAEKLSRAPVVYGRWGGVYRHFGESLSDKNDSESTHQARLVAITPIAKADTAEGLLRDIAEMKAGSLHDTVNFLSDISKRARALLAKGGV